MIKSEEQALQEVLQWLTLYFVKSTIEESILEIQLVKRDQSEEVAEGEKQECEEGEVFKEKKPSFEAQDPLKVNLGRMTNISGLLSEGDRDLLDQLIKKYKGLLCLGLSIDKGSTRRGIKLCFKSF